MSNNLTNNKQIINWLISGIIIIAMMLILGSITRLTNSGLSMVTWKPVTGTIPPLNQESWQKEFTKYKTSPEYLKKNYDFNLDEFKEIFYWEFSHRLLGRIAGLMFLFPFIYFLIKKKIKSKKLLFHLIVIFILGAMQAVIGWYMVKSGLRDNPHVSHYWLTIHLVTALFLISYIFITVLSLKFSEKTLETKNTKKLINLTRILLLLASLQIIYGGFVAGLKAGKLHNTFPKMGTEWFPNMISESFIENGFLTLFENHYTVMFIHRWLAVIVSIMTFYLVFKAQNSLLSLIQKKAINFLLIAIGIQFSLGVLTILYSVPVVLGVLHQFGAMLFLLSILTVLYFFKRNNKDERLV